jgi:uncharacterized protein
MSDHAKAPEKLLALQRRLGAHLRDPEHAAAPGNVEHRRLAIYRRLFFNNLSNLFRRNFPVIRKLYESAEWDALIRDFMIHQRPSTPMFTEIGTEFVQFLEDRRARSHDDPPWLLELARWEYLETQVRLHPADLDGCENRLEADVLETRLQVNPTLALAHFEWPVHKIGPAFKPDRPEAVWLAVWRRRDDETRFVRVNDLTARLIELSSEPGGNAAARAILARIAAEIPQPVEQVSRAGVALIQSLAEREILLAGG